MCMTPDVSQLRGRCGPKLVITGDPKHTIALSAFRWCRDATLFSCGAEWGRGQDLLLGQQSWKLFHTHGGEPCTSGQHYLLQNKASSCCSWGSGYTTGGWLPKSSDTDLWMVRGDRILTCSSALVFVKVLFFYPEVLWWLLSKVAALGVESFSIKWCLCHQTRDSALALNEVNMRGSSSFLAGGILLFLPLLL